MPRSSRVGPDSQLERKLERATVVAPHGDPLTQRALAVGAALDADSEPLRRKPLAARQNEVRIRQLVHRLGSRGGGRRQEAGQLAAEPQLERA
jgi:hypothetical protein